jgi:hypothetical protein
MLLHRFRFQGKNLAEMPEAERVFVVVLGSIANEINILQKFIIMAHDLEDDPEPAEIQGRTAQTMCLLRVLIGKLNEAYLTIRVRYLDAGLHSQIEDRFDENNIQVFEHFIEYFSKPKNNLNVLRNKIAFHNDWEFVRQNLKSVPDDAGMFIYTDETAGNTLFHFADLIAAFIMSNHVKPDDFEAGLDELTEEAVRLAGNLVNFSSACLAIMISRRIGLTQDQVELRSASKLGDVRIPFFMVPVSSPTAVVGSTNPTADLAP